MIASGITRESAVADFFLRRVVACFMKDVEQGASTTMYCALLAHDQLKGGFFNDCRPARYSRLVTDAACAALWELSAELCSEYLEDLNL